LGLERISEISRGDIFSSSIGIASGYLRADIYRTGRRERN